MQSDERFSIEWIKAAPENATRFIGTLGFNADIGPRETVKATRDWKDGKGEWHTEYVAEIDGPLRVRVKSAFLKEHKGKPFIQAQGLLLPRELSDSIAEKAAAMLKEKAAASGKKGNGR